MKRFIAVQAAALMVLLLGSSVLAASLGVSPSHVELEVPAESSVTADFDVYYFSGDIQVSLVDIPLTVEPETLHIEASSEPVPIQLTIHGDESLGSQIYNGYIRFLGMSGETVAVAVRIKAEITNIVEGQPLPEETSPEETTALAETTTAPPESPSPPAPAETSEWPIVLLAAIAAGTAIIITLIVVLARRSRY